MNRLQSLRLQFVGMADVNWKLLIVLVVAISIFLSFSLNVPLGSPEAENGVVISIGATHSTRTSLALPSVRIRLSSGTMVDIVVPYNVILREGQKVRIERISFFFGGESYAFGGVVNAQ